MSCTLVSQMLHRYELLIHQQYVGHSVLLGEVRHTLAESVGDCDGDDVVLAPGLALRERA